MTCAPSSTSCTVPRSTRCAGRRDEAGEDEPAQLLRDVPAHRLADVERYLRGAEWRLQRLTKNAAVDRDRMAGINELERLYDNVLRAQVAGRPEGELAEVPWLLEELRMTQFAQALGPKGQPTARKIRRILDGV